MSGLRFLTRLVHRSLTLPENLNLPCVSIFAVCFLSGTRQRAILPCATKKTPGLKKHTANSCFSVCLFFGTRQSQYLPCAKKKHTAKYGFAVCFFGTWQKNNFFLLLPQNFFYSLHITCVTSYLHLVHFCICLLYLTK